MHRLDLFRELRVLQTISEFLSIEFKDANDGRYSSSRETQFIYVNNKRL